jgi:hypothetical protein
MLGLDARMLSAHVIEDAQPKLVRVAHGVRLVGHVHAFPAALDRVVEGRANDPLDAAARVQIFVDRDLVGRTAPVLATDSDVNAFGILAKHHEIDVGLAPVLQRHQTIGQRAHGANVRVQVEAEAHSEQDVARMLHVGNACVAERAEQHRRAFALDRDVDLLWKGGAVAQVALRAEIELPQVERKAPS